ncbi:hypothetical protein PCE1_004679 [Barthelona sp. PCE]
MQGNKNGVDHSFRRKFDLSKAKRKKEAKRKRNATAVKLPVDNNALNPGMQQGFKEKIGREGKDVQNMFQCEVCNLRFTNSSTYLQHITSSVHQAKLGHSLNVRVSKEEEVVVSIRDIEADTANKVSFDINDHKDVLESVLQTLISS